VTKDFLVLMGNRDYMAEKVEMGHLGCPVNLV
jgi:hypothetical protein